jgi:hypothetical protein
MSAKEYLGGSVVVGSIGPGVHWSKKCINGRRDGRSKKHAVPAGLRGLDVAMLFTNIFFQPLWRGSSLQVVTI